ncbi:MAG: hypothetical protein ACLGG7_12170 [Bacteriovoracia bacterium]
MKHLAALVLLLLSNNLWASELRALAFGLVPQELARVKTLNEATQALGSIPDIKKRRDPDVLRVNYFGVNYDLNLGFVGERVDWLTLRPPSRWPRASGTYQRVTLLLTPLQVEKTKARFKGKELVVDFEGVVFKFTLPEKSLVELSIRDWADGP